MESSKQTALDSASTGVPLCVDLDGTLIRTDLFWESVILLLRRKIWLLFALPLEALRGRARLKRWIAARVQIDPERLPYDPEVIAWLRTEAESGRKLILVTGSDEMFARSVAAHLGMFDSVLASDGARNLTGRHKSRELVARFGAQGFDYAGNALADVAVWDRCKHAVVANARASTLRKARACSTVQRVFDRPENGLAWLRAMRPHQWSKNLLVFVPLIAGHEIFNVPLLIRAAWMFAAFSFGASAIYVFNDLVDIDADRKHPGKRRRPLAAGDLSIPLAGLLGVALLALAAATALFVNMAARLGLVSYIVLTVLYSILLKRKLLLDVFTLAGLYTLRIIAGGLATAIFPSAWLLAFSIFVFLSLAFAKRVTELDGLRARNEAVPERRAYQAADLEQMNIFGICSGFLACLVLVLFINSPQVITMYREPLLLWLLCPVLLYWVTRLWILVSRGQVDDDPVLFTLRDPASYIVGATGAALVILAYRGF